MRFAVNPAGVLRLARDFAAAPALVEQETARAMVESVAIAEAEVRSRTPVRTGRLRASVNGRVIPATAAGGVVRGTLTIGMPSYARFVEEGTRPHVIVARRKRALAFKVGGKVVIVRRVRHPGTKGAHMLRDGMAAARPRIEASFLRAADRLAEALAK